jgi:ABC-type branched-subunit amino acid transport system permease subunit
VSGTIDVKRQHAHAGADALGRNFFEASVRAMVAASFLNSPSGGCVASEVAVTSADQRFFDPAL